MAPPAPPAQMFPAIVRYRTLKRLTHEEAALVFLSVDAFEEDLAVNVAEEEVEGVRGEATRDAGTVATPQGEDALKWLGREVRERRTCSA